MWFIIWGLLLLLVFLSEAAILYVNGKNNDSFGWPFLALLIIGGFIFVLGQQTAAGYPVDIDKMKAGQEYTVVSLGEGKEILFLMKEQKFQYLVLEANGKVVIFRASDGILPLELSVGDIVTRSTENEIRITKSFGKE
ncbi:MAG: hypothetical protein ABH919_00220 [bacterium]